MVTRRIQILARIEVNSRKTEVAPDILPIDEEIELDQVALDRVEDKIPVVIQNLYTHAGSESFDRDFPNSVC